MRLRAHRRNLVVWSSSARPADRFGPRVFIQLGRTGRLRRLTRTGALLMVVGLLRLTRAVRPRWRPLLAGGTCTVAGVILRSSSWGAILLPGLLLLSYCLLVPASPDEDHKRLERELAAYSTQAQRDDLEATMDRYPDTITRELRDILAGQAMAACDDKIPGAGWGQRG
jgi:hypothetical protein